MSLDLIIDIVIDFRIHFLRASKSTEWIKIQHRQKIKKEFKLEKFPQENWFVMLFTHYHNNLTENITLRFITQYLEQGEHIKLSNSIYI